MGRVRVPGVGIRRSEVTRFREIRAGVVKPSLQLWIGLLVLAYPTVVGIALPVFEMATGPKDITTYTKILVWLFISGLILLLAYMAYFALRLSRRSADSAHDSR